MTCAALSLVVMLAVQQADPQDTKPAATVRGRVVTADTRSPIPGARVTMTILPPLTLPEGMPPAIPMVGRAIVTARDGSFEFRDVPPGRYGLNTSSADDAPQFLPMATEAVVEILPGERLKQVDLRMVHAGVISGRVTDVDGVPLTNILVYALLVPGDRLPGRTRRNSAQATDDLGQFRIYGLADGEYLVGAEPRHTADAAILRSAVATTSPPDGLISTFYPGVIDEATAARVRVRVGAETGNVVVRMAQGRRSRVAGVVVDSGGRPLARTTGSIGRPSHRMSGIDGLPFTTDGQGRFEVRDLAPGTYRLSVQTRPAMSGGALEQASVEVALTGTDVDNLIVRTGRGALVRGLVELAPAPAETMAPARIAVKVWTSDGSCDGRSSMSVLAAEKDNTFEIGDLFCASFINASVPGYVPKTVMLNGADIIDTPVRFADGDRITITLWSLTSTLDGIVVDDVGPVAGCDVLTFSQEPGRWVKGGSTIHRATTDAKGRFTLPDLLSGRYFVVAARRERLAAAIGGDPAFFAVLSQYATPLVIGERERRTVELRLTAAGDR